MSLGIENSASRRPQLAQRLWTPQLHAIAKPTPAHINFELVYCHCNNTHKDPHTAHCIALSTTLQAQISLHSTTLIYLQNITTPNKRAYYMQRDCFASLLDGTSNFVLYSSERQKNVAFCCTLSSGALSMNNHIAISRHQNNNPFWYSVFALYDRTTQLTLWLLLLSTSFHVWLGFLSLNNS